MLARRRARSRLRAPACQDRGAVAVEFALIFPLLLVIVFGLIQYGFYFWSMQGGSAAAREGARRAAVGKPVSCSDFKAYVKDRIGSTTGDGSTLVVTRTYKDYVSPFTKRTAPTEVQLGDVVTVTVRFKSYDLNFPFVPFIEDGWVAQSADSRVENIDSPPEICS